MNSAHPFENPTQITNFIASLAILAVPAGLTYTFGVMVRDTRQGWTIWAAMWLIFALCTVAFAWFELDTPHVLTDLGVLEGVMNPEGKEARFDIAATALFPWPPLRPPAGRLTPCMIPSRPLEGCFRCG